MANPGKSAELKALIGSREKGPELKVLQVIGEIPEPPRRLEESGLELWKTAWSLGWLSTKADITALSILCERMDERDLLRSFVLDNPEAWRERAGLRKLEDSIEANLKTLLLNPSERLKAGIAEAKPKSAFEELKELRTNGDI
jgi:hypothetical protein